MSADLPRLHHVTLLCDDLQTCAAFYHREFGLEYVPKPGLDYPAAFFRINEIQELHLAEMPDEAPSFRGHFCLRVPDFNAIFWRMDALGILTTRPWGKVRELPGGVIQCYVRDPAGNLVEITSNPEERGAIDPAILEHPAWGGEPYCSGLNDGRTYQPHSSSVSEETK